MSRDTEEWWVVWNDIDRPLPQHRRHKTFEDAKADAWIVAKNKPNYVLILGPNFAWSTYGKCMEYVEGYLEQPLPPATIQERDAGP